VFDDIGTRPEEMLLEAMQFLGIDSDDGFTGDLAREEVNPAGGSRSPEQVPRLPRRDLCRRHPRVARTLRAVLALND